MDRFAEKAYLMELESQCRGALAAVHRMNGVLRGGGMPLEFFHHAQSFISHAGAISRIFWPPRIRDRTRHAVAQGRGRHLRALLNIASPNVLEDRTLRNHFEHFDERLDEWANSTKTFNFADLIIMPRGGISGFPQESIFREFDPSTNILYFRGQSFDVQRIVNGLEDVLEAILACPTFARPTAAG